MLRISLLSIILLFLWCQTDIVGGQVVEVDHSKGSRALKEPCLRGAWRTGRCIPCQSATCVSSLACSLNGFNTVCDSTKNNRRRNLLRSERVREAVKCSNFCGCAEGHCNSSDDCPENSLCSGGDATSTFSVDSISVCRGTCFSTDVEFQRYLQVDSETSSNSPTSQDSESSFWPSASPLFTNNDELSLSTAPSTSITPDGSEDSDSQPETIFSALPSLSPALANSDEPSSSMPSVPGSSSPSTTDTDVAVESLIPSSLGSSASSSISPTDVEESVAQSHSPSSSSGSMAPSMVPSIIEENISTQTQSPSSGESMAASVIPTLVGGNISTQSQSSSITSNGGESNTSASPSPIFPVNGTDIFDSGAPPSQAPTSGLQNLVDECFVGSCDSDTDCTDEEICSGATESIPCNGSCILENPADIFDPDSNSTCSDKSCSTSNDCFDGLVCLGGNSSTSCSGICSPLTNATQCSDNSCATDDDCPQGPDGLEVCVGANGSARCSGMCLPEGEDNLFGDDGNSTCTGGSCSLDFDCSETEQCIGAIAGFLCSGECQKQDDTTTTCSGPTECDSDLDCRTGLELCTRQLETDMCGTCMIPDIDDSDDDETCPSTTCRTDDDCILGLEICDSILVDVSLNSTDCLGLCVAQNKTEVQCTSLDGCKPGLETCEGLDVSTNTPGNCTSIVCTNLLTCGTDSDCFDGLEACQGFDGINPCSGQCVHRSCASDERTDSCSSSSDCPSSTMYECLGFDGSTACSGTCALMSCPGDTCTTTAECAGGQKCSGSNGVDSCSGQCQTLSLRFQNYRGQRMPHFGKGFDFGKLFFSNRSILLGGRRDGSGEVDDEKLNTFLS